MFVREMIGAVNGVQTGVQRTHMQIVHLDVVSTSHVENEYTERNVYYKNCKIYRKNDYYSGYRTDLSYAKNLHQKQ